MSNIQKLFSLKTEVKKKNSEYKYNKNFPEKKSITKLDFMVSNYTYAKV